MSVLNLNEGNKNCSYSTMSDIFRNIANGPKNGYTSSEILDLNIVHLLTITFKETNG